MDEGRKDSEARSATFRELLAGTLPVRSAQAHLLDITHATLAEMNPRMRILDLGCGGGTHTEFFQTAAAASEYIGLDLIHSPEVMERTIKSGSFVTYDGINIPVHDSSIDLVFSNQVFEHVRHPERLLQEVWRVLRPKGIFIGSTSQLEPYHSYSLWNYTVYGFRVLLEDAGLRPLEFWPGIDALTLIMRRGMRRRRLFDRWWRRESPLNGVIERVGRLRGRPPADVVAAKLLFAGQFGFKAEKDSSGTRHISRSDAMEW